EAEASPTYTHPTEPQRHRGGQSGSSLRDRFSRAEGLRQDERYREDDRGRLRPAHQYQHPQLWLERRHRHRQRPPNTTAEEHSVRHQWHRQVRRAARAHGPFWFRQVNAPQRSCPQDCRSERVSEVGNLRQRLCCQPEDLPPHICLRRAGRRPRRLTHCARDVELCCSPLTPTYRQQVGAYPTHRSSSHCLR
ncbi:hypothetical protein B0A50_08825, partial [Salinomyces thailandicus]